MMAACRRYPSRPETAVLDDDGRADGFLTRIYEYQRNCSENVDHTCCSQ